MSVETDMLYISVIGPKANVTRMLNEAIRQEGAGELIVEGDDIETINRKITGKDGKPGMMVKFAELIDEKCLEDDAILKERWEAAVERQKKKDAEDTSDGDFEMDLELAKVEKYDSGLYEVKFSEYVPEWVADFDCIDWAGWEDISRVYKCRVFVDDDEYYNGAFWRFCGTTIYKPEKGGVSKKRFEPQLDLEGYKKVYDELIELNPERYRAKKIQDFEDKITRMQNEIYREKINVILSQLYEPDTIDIPGDIVRIPSHAFNGCKEILWAFLNEGTIRIGDNAFLDCSSLIGVSLPSTLREIGSGAFKDCQSLEKIVLPASLESLGRDAFKGCNLKSIKVQPGNGYWYSKGNCLFDKEDNTLLLGCKKSVIPEGTTAIADGAFWECAGLKSIVIPSGVARVGNHSFRNCTGLKRVVIPGTVTCISEWSFTGCTSLEEVVIEDGVQTIDVAAFANCTSLKRIVIPPSVKQISAARFARGAFEGCTSLTAVDLPAGVSISEGAFKGCPCEEMIKEKYSK